MRWTLGPSGRSLRRWLVVGVLAVAVLGFAAFAVLRRPAPVATASSTVPVRRGTVSVTLSAAGAVQPAQTRGLSFSTAGVVTELNVKAGDAVSAGQALARIDSTSVLDEVNTAQASVNSASDALTRAQQTPTPAATPACAAGAVRAAPAAYVQPAGTPTPTPTETEQPTPTETPSPSPTVSPSPTRQAGGGQQNGGGSQPNGGRATCAATGGGTTGGGTGGGGTGGAGGRTGGADGLLSAEQQLTNARLALQLAQDKLAGTTITAPVAGRVLSVAGTLGAQQSPGGNGFIVLGGVTENDVRAQFSEADVGHLAVGQSATITRPNRPGESLTGKVSQIDPAGVASGRLVRYGVVVAFDQPPADVLLGETANVAVVTGSATDVLYVSSAAVVDVANQSGTVTVRAAGHDTGRTVQIGLRGDQFTEIRSGLAEGEQVVLSGRR